MLFLGWKVIWKYRTLSATWHKYWSKNTPPSPQTLTLHHKWSISRPEKDWSRMSTEFMINKHVKFYNSILMWTQLMALTLPPESKLNGWADLASGRPMVIREPSEKIGVRIFQPVKWKKSQMMISQGYALSYMSCTNVCAEQGCLLNRRERVNVSNRKLHDYPVNYTHPRAIITPNQHLNREGVVLSCSKLL